MPVLAALALAAWGTAAAAAPAPRTTISLAGRDDSTPKLGLPGVGVTVEARSGGAAVAGELRRELARLVHTRALAPGEPGDYTLTVKLEDPDVTTGVTTHRFEAVLAGGAGETLWRVDGRSEISGPPDPAVFDSIARNVVSALIHDGWVAPRYDPDDPPPPPPTIRNDIGGR